MIRDLSVLDAGRPVLLSDIVFEKLLSDIVGGRFRPTERLDLDELASEFQVSRTPVREALRHLAELGLVEISRNARTAVARWSAADMRERAMLAGDLAASAMRGWEEPLELNLVPLQAYETDLLAFLDLVAQLVSERFPRAGRHLIVDLVSPLKAFLRPAVLARHGLSSEQGCAERQRMLVQTLDALGRRELRAAAEAFDAYRGCLAEVLACAADPATATSTARHGQAMRLRAVSFDGRSRLALHTGR